MEQPQDPTKPENNKKPVESKPRRWNEDVDDDDPGRRARRRFRRAGTAGLSEAQWYKKRQF